MVFRFIQSWTRDSREIIAIGSVSQKETFGGVPMRELN
jgi:hypothetical protein